MRTPKGRLVRFTTMSVGRLEVWNHVLCDWKRHVLQSTAGKALGSRELCCSVHLPSMLQICRRGQKSTNKTVFADRKPGSKLTVRIPSFMTRPRVTKKKKWSRHREKPKKAVERALVGFPCFLGCLFASCHGLSDLNAVRAALVLACSYSFNAANSALPLTASATLLNRLSIPRKSPFKLWIATENSLVSKAHGRCCS